MGTSKMRREGTHEGGVGTQEACGKWAWQGAAVACEAQRFVRGKDAMHRPTCAT